MRLDVKRLILGPVFLGGLLAVMVSAVPKCLQAAIPVIERQALIAFYESTGGDNWDNNDGWKHPPLESDGFALRGTECAWHGVVCDASATVTWIELINNNLVGVIPADLENLPNLAHLLLGSNHLSGSIPPELGNLTDMKQFGLDGNDLTGSIPPELGNLAELSSLHLGWNQLTGVIPPELGNLSALISLDLRFNDLSGGIPPELGNLANLQ
jgi:hypothetical protein